MKHCPYCGEEIDSEDNHCVHCGSHIHSNVDYEDFDHSENYESPVCEGE